ncbi:PREDICTED: putative serine protease K12H4.7 [Rhagoletis zephyria]|uniref:putative serine protease K12H4.7 n=1 Tax=Rhagoletis zephyria TaxID=28612 RepID=UPI0008113C3A|nr:PREDICTED: putative serine protease K12H4.7 [Rhagoletis zephyria]
MTAIYRILNARMQTLAQVVVVVLACQEMLSQWGLATGMQEVKQEATQIQNRFKAFARSLRLLRGEPPLKGKVNLMHKDVVQELWMEQQLDHFDERNNKTWLMRYFRNDHYFQPKGPIFIFVGGEWEITPTYLLTGHMHDIARQHNGMLYYVEHRFYGRSWPLGDAGVVNLKYLSSRQALADLAHFIQQLKFSEVELAKSKIILTGASYSASLVAWFARLYPNLMSAGWASSAPLLAKVDFYEYMQQVGNVIQHRGGHKCTERLEAGLERIATLLESSNASKLLQALRICNNFKTTNQLDRAALFNGIGNYFAAYAQLYDDQVSSICATLITATADANDLTAFIQFIMQIFWPEALERTQSEDWCIDLSYAGMKSIFADDTDQLSGTRQWFYQSCHEFGWFATTASSKNAWSNSGNSNNGSHNIRPKDIRQAALRRRHEQPPTLAYSFGHQVPLNYFQQLCRDVFDPLATGGDDISTSVQQTNKHFGGLTAAAITLQQRVIFTHGQLDPWRVVGLQEGNNVIMIPDYSHTADLDSINFDDAVEMNVAKLKVAAFLRRALRT